MSFTFSALSMHRDKRTLYLWVAHKGRDREKRKELLGPTLCVMLHSIGWQFGAGCSAGLYWGLQSGCHFCPSPVIIQEGTCPYMGGDIPLLGSDKSPLPLLPPQAAGLCLVQPGKQVFCSRQGLSGEGGHVPSFGGFLGDGL